jgi:hypothetical protein
MQNDDANLNAALPKEKKTRKTKSSEGLIDFEPAIKIEKPIDIVKRVGVNEAVR